MKISLIEEKIKNYFFFIYYLFFVSVFIFILTKVNLNQYLFSLTIISLLPFILYRTISRSTILFIVSFNLYLLLFIGIGILNDLTIASSIKQYLYYLKPLIFFWIGYLFLESKAFTSFLRFCSVFLLIGTIVYYLNPFYFIELAQIKNPDGQGLEHFYSLGGLILRNASFLLSPLDTAFCSFFIGIFFIQNYKNRKDLFYILSNVIVLLSTFTRSAILGFLAALFVIVFDNFKILGKFFFILFASLLVIMVLVIYYDIIEAVFILDGSASIHHENLVDALKLIFANPMGYGLGFSGWSASANENSFYSEGFIFSVILELGILFLLFYVLILLKIIRNFKKELLPLFIGFFVASLLIPIGYSTIFNLLLFSYFGILYKTNVENSNYHRKLER